MSIRGIRQPIPGGTMLCRMSSGNGPPTAHRFDDVAYRLAVQPAFAGAFDTKGAAATVQANLDAHKAATGTAVHGLGTASTHDATDFDAAGLAAVVQDNLNTHAALTSTAHGGIIPEAPNDGTAYARKSLAWAAVAAGGAIYGTAIVDFGGWPGNSIAPIVVTGQAGILAGSNVQAFVMADDTTADHTANDHRYAALLLGLSCGAVVPGTGFTIFATCADLMQGTFNIRWQWA